MRQLKSEKRESMCSLSKGMGWCRPEEGIHVCESKERMGSGDGVSASIISTCIWRIESFVVFFSRIVMVISEILWLSVRFTHQCGY